MNHIVRNRQWIAVISTGAVIALAALAVGLRDVSFRPGQIMGPRDAEAIQVAVARVVREIQDVVWWEQAMLWGLLFTIVLLIGAMLSPEGRRRLIRGFLRFAAIFWAVYVLMKYRGDFLLQLSMGPELQTPLPDSGAAGPIPVFEPPQLSGLAIFVLSLGIALGLVLLFIGLTRWWTRRRARPQAQKDEIAEIARLSLAQLRAGSEWGNVIEDCYVRMSRAVEARRGLYRQEAVTPAEFSVRLERAGLPAEAVQGLTGLFEAVRYGARRSSQAEVDRAVACLHAILRSCGEIA